MSVQFFQTRMGVRFFESTMPQIAAELEKLNKSLASMVVVDGRGLKEDLVRRSILSLQRLLCCGAGDQAGDVLPAIVRERLALIIEDLSDAVGDGSE